MDAILIQRKSRTVAFHPKHIQNARDLPGNAAGDIGFDFVIDLLFQSVLKRRMRFLFIEPKYMTRQTDVQRILYANNLLCQAIYA